MSQPVGTIGLLDCNFKLLGFDFSCAQWSQWFGCGVCLAVMGMSQTWLATAGLTGALLSNGTTNLLADRTMASATGNGSRRTFNQGLHPSPLCMARQQHLQQAKQAAKPPCNTQKCKMS